MRDDKKGSSASARNQEVRAEIDYNKVVAALQPAMGMMLGASNIAIDPVK